MKILHVVEPFSSGIITFIINLTKALPNCQHTVMHGTRTTEDQIRSVRSRFPEYVNFRIWKNVRREMKPLYDLRALIELRNYIKKNNFDIVHLHSAKAGFLGRLLTLILNVKVIYSPNGAPFLRQDISGLKQKLFLVLEKTAYKMNRKLVCCGKSESDLYCKYGMKNIYINNAVPIRNEPIHELKFPITIGSMAILTFQKDPEMFSRIASHFEQDNRVRFIWVGDGLLRSKMNEKAVFITGWIDEKNALNHLSQMDIYLSTAKWEGQPFAVIEAMERSKYLILRNCIGNQDLVYEKSNGILFDKEEQAINEIMELLEKPELISKGGEYSRKMCEVHHDMIKMGKLYYAEYEKLADTHK